MMQITAITFLFPLIVFYTKDRVMTGPIGCATQVEECPMGEYQWKQKNDQLNCTAKYGYVCMRDFNGHLFESCMVNFTVNVNTSNCPVFACRRNSPFLGPTSNYYYCPENEKGCPEKNHAYSIYELYKYPKCIEFTLIDVVRKTEYFSSIHRSESMTSTSMATETSDEIDRTEMKHLLVSIVSSCLLLTVTLCFICYCAFSKKTSTDYKKLQELICEINESEADRIKVLKYSKANDIDSIYVNSLMVDDCGGTNKTSNDEGEIPYITPDMLFKVNPVKQARYVFMLGEAGYGKTMQCQRIAKSWCQQLINGKKDTYANHYLVTGLEKSLREFDFLFFIKMRDVQTEHVSLIDMIQEVYSRYHLSKKDLDGIRIILEGSSFKSIVLLDGLDEWFISDDKKSVLLDECVPNCRDMPNCTILFSMRSWKFIQVEEKLCRPKFDKVIRLHGLEEKAFQELTEKMLNNYIKGNVDSSKLEKVAEFERKSENVQRLVKSPSFELKSLMKIPLLAVFCILTLYEDVGMGNSLTTLYFSIIEALIKRYYEKHAIEVKQTFPKSSFTQKWDKDKYPRLTALKHELLKLGETAFKSLTSECNVSDMGEENVHLFLDIGIVIKQHTSRKIYEDKIRLTFLHKSIQEFLLSLYLYQEKGVSEIIKSVSDAVEDIERALQFSNVLTFLSGLSPEVGCKISHLIKALAGKDKDIGSYRDYFDAESYQKVFYLYNLQLRCYKEVRGSCSITEFESKEQTLKFVFSDIILLANDTEASIVRDSVELLHFHANDIVSLNIVCIPDDKDNGITNREIRMFLYKSKSIKSLYIDGYSYVKGKCRLFDNHDLRTSGLRTFGLANVAFTENYLSKMLTKDQSKRGIRALGLLYLKSENDLFVDFEYDIPSIHWISTGRSGFIRKIRIPSERDSSLPTVKTKISFLREFLDDLPKYKVLSTLYISYMEACADKLKLKEILPALKELKTLTHIGYRGSSFYPNPDKNHDEAVITCIMELKTLQKIHLREINLKENILNFRGMTDLERIWLGMLTMESSHWESFLKSLSSNTKLKKVILYDTNVESAVFEQYKTLYRCVDMKNIEGTDS